MFKIIGGVIVGVFIGALVLEILKRHQPDLLEGIEKKAKKASDKLFESLRESYDFRKTE
jgi:hypothetical protein